jgi:sulfoxide reductase heme-binding subunit YedZ
MSRIPIARVKAAVFVAALIPLGLLVLGAVTNRLGPNPVETIEHETGQWTLYCLLATLAITPLRRLTGWNAAVRLRRMLGLYAFFYACLHFSAWLVFDHFFDWMEIVKDIGKRPYVTVGFSAFLLLLPLAITSTDGMIRRLGGGRWRRLHSIVYVIGTLAILHFLWLVKADTREPILYGILLIGLLALRLPAVAMKAASRPRPVMVES